jgi:cyanophycinase
VPAPVPPGFTRGPIIFFGPFSEERSADRLLQSFWDEVGSYGARVLIVSTGAVDGAEVEHLRTWFAAAEVDSLAVLPLRSRPEAMDAGLVSLVDNATGILIVDSSPLRFTSICGGTPVAQAIRRANARGRAVGAVGRAGAVLCQHMIAFDHRAALPGAFLHRSLIQFAPGLGIVNRLALDCGDEPGAHFRTHLSRLLTAVAYNPFLIGVALDPDTGAVVYPDSTLEVFGAGSALVVDGWQITHTDLYDHADESPMSVLGVQMHILGHGYTYHLDTHTARRPPESEIPKAGYEQYGSF